MASLGAIPFVFNNLWENTINYYATNPQYTSVKALDYDLPTGARSYVYGKDKILVSRGAAQGFADKMWEGVKSLVGYAAAAKETVKSGYRTAKETIEQAAEVAANTVSKVFYGVLALGSMGIIYKLVS
jgi:hypothetical protein